MHELSVALGLLEGVEETAAQQGIERVAAIHVRVGALSGIAPDALSFSWDLATEDTIAAGSALQIEDRAAGRLLRALRRRARTARRAAA